MKLRRCLSLFAVVSSFALGLLTIGLGGTASAADPQMDEIQNFVTTVCVIPPTSGSSRELTIKGNFDASLPMFLKRMADLGVHFEGSEVNRDFQGVAQLDLAGAIATGNQCREDLAKKLIDRLPSAPQQSETPYDNTYIGNNPPVGGLSGHNNTVIGPTDNRGNVIIRTGTAVGAGACADSTSIAIGAGAMAGECAQTK